MKKLKILCLLDNLTYQGLKFEENISLFPMLRNIYLNKIFKPDLILVESAWFGYMDIWKHKLVNFPNKFSDLEILKIMLEWANKNKIPVLFWNKEDPIHFDKFKQCADLFNFVATTDFNCIPKYTNSIKTFYLPFAYQPKIHFFNFKEDDKRVKKGIFMGSYLTNNHPMRKKWQDTFFPIFSKYGLDIYDRNSKLNNKNYLFPDYNNSKLFSNVSYRKTGTIMRKYFYSINVNSVTDSPTMFSRRILESIASGCLTFSNKSNALDNLFQDCCIQIDNKDILEYHLDNIKNNNIDNYNKIKEYAYYTISKEYSYEIWVKKILNEINIKA